MACDHGMMLMSDHDDTYVDAMLMVNMQYNTRSVTVPMPRRPVLAPRGLRREPYPRRQGAG